MIKVNFPEKIRLADIDTEDNTFSISFPRDVERLKASIKEVGLLKPLILRNKNGNSPFQIISGYKRGIVLKDLGIDFVPAYIFKNYELDDESALRLNLLENLHTREINHIEISNFLFKLKENLNIEPEKIIEAYLPLLWLEKSFLILKKYLSLQNLIADFKELAITKKFHMRILTKLSFLTQKDQVALLKLTKELELGFNFLNVLLTLLEEIAKRDKVTISTLILDKSVNDILNRVDISRDLKTKLLISMFKEQRYPHIHNFMKRIKSHVNNLNLPNDVAIDIPENLEREAITMRFKFRDKKDYHDILNTLIKISDSEDFSAILEMI